MHELLRALLLGGLTFWLVYMFCVVAESNMESTTVWDLRRKWILGGVCGALVTALSLVAYLA